MALPEQQINVNLRPLNQQAPTTAGPVGRVDSINNGVVHKFTKGGQGPMLRIDKRPGFSTLSSELIGNVGSLPGTPRWLSDFRGQLIGIFDAQPYVYSEPDDKWVDRQLGAYPVVAYQTLSKRAVFNLNSIASSPDSASAGQFIASVMRSGVAGVLTAYLVIQDVNGVNTVAPTATIITNSARIKVVSDGAQFWVFSQAAALTSTAIQVIDATGVTLATSTIAWGAARDNWDVRYAAGLAQVVLATPLGATTDLRFMTYAALAITTAVHTTPAADCTKGCGFLDNSAGTNIYLGGADNGYAVRGFEFSNAGALTHTFDVDLANTTTVQNITGYAEFGAATPGYVVVAYALEPAPAAYSARNNMTKVVTVPRGGGSSTSTVRSVSLASRAWPDAQGNYFAVTYYQSTALWDSVSNVDISTIDMQPSYFVLFLGTTVARTVGQFEYGSAAFVSGAQQSVYYNPFHLSSVTADADGKFHTSLGYFGVQSVSSVTVPLIGPTTALTNLVGVNDYIIDPAAGRPVATTDELLIPGLQAQRFDGTVFVEDGMALAPEVSNFTVSAGGSLTSGELYNWVGVYEWLDNAGNVIDSIPSTPYAATPSGGNLTAVISFTTLRTTAKENVRVSVYRTFSPTLNTTPGLELRKVGEVMNNTGADSVTFTDDVADAVVAVGSELYTQPLILTAPQPLDHYPAPSFSRGIAADGRTFVIGWDGAIWFSEQRVDGLGSPFNPEFRVIMPTTSKVLSLVPMDARIVILCEDGTAWTIPIGGLPNATLTTGSIPQPEQLPSTVGTTGAGLMLPIGAIFGANEGAWLMDRGLSMEFIGAGIMDELGGSTQIIDICVDQQQRVYFTLGIDQAGGTLTRILAYDLVVGCWYTWDAPVAPVVACSWKGRYVFADIVTPSRVWLLDRDDATDFTDEGTEIITTVALSSMSFGGPNGFMSLWGGQFFGQYKGSHLVDVTFTFDNDAAPEQTFTQPVGVDPGTYRWEFRQDRRKEAAVAVTFSDSFTWPTLATILDHAP